MIASLQFIFHISVLKWLHRSMNCSNFIHFNMLSKLLKTRKYSLRSSFSIIVFRRLKIICNDLLLFSYILDTLSSQWYRLFTVIIPGRDHVLETLYLVQPLASCLQYLGRQLRVYWYHPSGVFVPGTLKLWLGCLVTWSGCVCLR